MKIIISILLLCIISFSARSQDTHYWSHQYGPKSTLLGGSDAAVSKDNSAIINNPGGLGFNDQASLSVTTNAYSVDFMKFKDGAGAGLDMKSTKVHSIPLILSGVFKHKKHPKWTVGYALVDRVRYKFEATQRFDDMINVIDDGYSPGQEEFVSQLDMRNRLKEIWAGFTIAYRINEHFAVGMSNFGAYRDHQFSSQYTARAVINSPFLFETSTSDFLYNVSYISVRNIFKLGVTASFDNFDAGLSVTMPSFNMYSRAIVNSDLTSSNVIIDDVTNTRGSIIANDRQEKLPANYKSPFSVSLGLSKQFKKTRLFVTSEYFAGIKQYVYISPKNNSFIRPAALFGGSSSEILQVAGGKKPVLNIAIGVEQQLSEKLTLMAGIRTDNSFYDESAEDIGNSLSFTSASLYHASAGVSIERAKGKVCIGLKGSYGSNTLDQEVNLTNPQDNLILMGDTYTTQYTYYNVSFVLGYIHYLK
ncbi:MAG: hypothetical protein R2800_08780 [Flavipsychrobacter sp.]